jgi:hypothetical protein
MTTFRRVMIGVGLLSVAGTYELVAYRTVPAVYATRPHVEFLALGGFAGTCPRQTCKDDGTNGCKDSNANESCQGGENGCSQSNCSPPQGGD